MFAAVLLLACSSPTGGGDDDDDDDPPPGGGSDYDLVALSLTAGAGSATDAVTLSPAFTGATHTYTATVGQNVDTLAVSVTLPNVENAEYYSVSTFLNESSFTYPGGTATLDYGANELEIIYGIPEEGAPQYTYTVTITRATTSWSSKAAIADMKTYLWDHAMDSSGNMAVAYKSSDNQIKIARYSAAGDSWTEIYSAAEVADYFDSVALAYDSNDDLIAVTVTQEGTGLSAKYYPTVQRYSGGSWTTIGYEGLKTAASAVQLFSTPRMDVALDADDNIYVASEASYTSTIDKKVFVLKYDSGTAAWSSLGWVPENSLSGNENYKNISMEVAAEDEIYVAMMLASAVSPANGVTVFGYDGGGSWSQVGDPLTTYGVARISGAVAPVSGIVTYLTGNGTPNYRLSGLVSGSWASTEFTYDEYGDETATFAFDASDNVYVPFRDGSTSDISIKKYDGTNWTAPFTPITGITGYTTPVYAAVNGNTLYVFGRTDTLDPSDVFWMRTTTIE
jgi:hypothetical protein